MERTGTCGVTSLPVYTGDRVVCFILEKISDVGNYHPCGMFRPVAFPMRGMFSGKGILGDITVHESVIGWLLGQEYVGGDEYDDDDELGAGKKDDGSWRFGRITGLLEKINQGKLMIVHHDDEMEGEAQTRKLSLYMVLEEVYDALVEYSFERLFDKKTVKSVIDSAYTIPLMKTGGADGRRAFLSHISKFVFDRRCGTSLDLLYGELSNPDNPECPSFIMEYMAFITALDYGRMEFRGFCGRGPFERDGMDVQRLVSSTVLGMTPVAGVGRVQDCGSGMLDADEKVD